MALLTFGKIRQLGWVFVFFGAAFAVGLLPYVEPPWRSYDAVGEGEVLEVARSSSTENDEPVYWVIAAHEAPAPDGPSRQRYLLRSYTLTPPVVGERVTVEYQSADPSDARVRGGRTRPMSSVALLVLLFPCLALLFALRGVRQRAGVLHLLRHGRLIVAKPIAIQRGDLDGDGESESVVRLAFRDAEGAERTFEVHTFSPELLTDAAELALYDPEQPRHATALDALPGKLEVLEDRVVSRARLWHLQIAPILALAAVVAAGVSVSRMPW